MTKRVVLAQVAGLRELCEHTSDEVRNSPRCFFFHHSSSPPERPTPSSTPLPTPFLPSCHVSRFQRQLEEQVGGSLAARGVRYKHVETTEDDENFFESCTEASDDEGYAVDLDPTHQHADAEHCEEPGTPRHGAAASSGGEQPPHGEDRSRAVSDMDSEADVARDGDAGSLDKVRACVRVHVLVDKMFAKIGTERKISLTACDEREFCVEYKGFRSICSTHTSVFCFFSARHAGKVAV